MDEFWIKPVPKFEFKDVKFMTAREKARVLRNWETFLKHGCKKEHFTKALYSHLIMHCSFIAHYDINGFYSTYFEEGEDTVHFLSQFDNSKGIPRSVEIGMTYWITDGDYYDINIAMCQVAAQYIPALVDTAKRKQKEVDILRAEALLAKHGITLKEVSPVNGKH